MTNSFRTEHYAGNAGIMTAGILTSAFGLLAMLGWIFHFPMLASFGANLIPMAPSTALFFILIGLALTLRSRLPQNRGAYFYGLSIGLMVAVSGLLFFISFLAKNYMPIEHLFFPMPDTLSNIQVGHMSPATAVSFLACALVFLLTLPQSVERSKRAWFALISIFVLALSWLLFLFAYLLQTPLLYGGGFIPPALPTSLAFLSLSMGLLISSAHQTGIDHRVKVATATRVSYVFLLIFILLAAGILTGGYFAFREYEQNYRREIEQQLSAVAELKVNQLFQWRKERLGDASIFYKNHVFSDLVKRYFKNQTDADAKKKIQAWIEQVAAAFTYDRICLHDIAGTEHISFPQTRIHPPEFFSVYSAKVLKTGKAEFQDFFRDENDMRVYLTIFIPIFDEYDDKKPLGVVALRIDPAHYLYPLIEKWPTPSRTSETLIIRRDGNDALFLNNLRFRKDAALNLRSPITNEKMPAVKAALGQTGIVEGIDYRGVPVIADVRAVPDSPWFIVARMDMAEVYAPLRERFWLMIILIGALLSGAGLGVFLVWRQQRNRFYREKHKSAEALEISQSTLAAAERLGKVGSWEFDIDTKALIWSEEVCRIHEVDINFKPTLEAGINFYAPASRPVIERAVQRAIEQGEPFDLELEINTAKNNLRWIHTIGDIDPKRRKVFGFFQDITERMRAEEALRESGGFIQAVMDNLPLGVAVNSVDPSVNFNYMNDNFPAIYHTTREALAVRDNFWNAVYEEPAFREEMRKRVLADIASGESERMHWEDIPITRKGEKTTYINARNVSVPGKSLMISTVWDITERKLAEEKVLESQAELRKALEISNKSRQALLSVIEDLKQVEKSLKAYSERLTNLHRIDKAVLQAIDSPEKTTREAILHVRNLLHCQRVSVRMFDFEKKEARVFAAIGDLDSEMHTGWDLSQELFSDLDILRQGKLEIIEDSLKMETVSASIKTIRAQENRSSINAPIVSSKGLIGVLTIGWDTPRIIPPEEQEITSEVASQIAITIEHARLLQETKRHAEELEEQVRLRTAQLEASNIELEAFSYSVSHDLRAPLRHINGYVELLSDRFHESLPEKGKHYLQTIADSAGQMGALIDDLLQFSRTGRQELHLAELDMNRVLLDVLDALKQDVSGRSIRWKTGVLPSVLGDRALLRLVWSNLLENAVKFTRKKEKARIEVGLMKDSKEHIFFVRDNGAGFDMKYAHKLFGVFQRLHTSAEFEGTGIGLANVRRIILKHEGRTWAEAESGKGATFYFSLPKSKEKKI